MSTKKISIDDFPLTRFHWKMTFYTGGGAFIDGYIIGIIGIALSFIQPQLGLSTVMTGLVGSATLAGLFLGALAFGYITDLIGRRLMFILNLVVFVIASVLQFFITNSFELLILRFLIGLAVGADYPIASSMLAEFTPRRHRGLLMGTLLGGYWVGYVMSFLIGYLLIDVGDDNWRWMLASSAVPALILLICRLDTPESPRWLKEKGRIAEARAILDKHLGDNVELPETSHTKTSFINIFRKGYLKRIIFVSSYWILQVAPGYALALFTPSILENFNITGDESFKYLGSLIISVFYFIGVIPGILLVDKIGRRPLLIWPFLISGMILVVLGGLGHAPAWFVLLLFALYAIVHSATSVLQWLYPNELFPTDVRATAVGFTTAMSRIGAVIGTFFLPLCISSLGVGVTMYINAALFFLGWIISYFMAPETNKLSLSEASSISTNTKGQIIDNTITTIKEEIIK
jgi:putative MFS transporter